MSLAQGLRSHEHVPEASNTPKEVIFFFLSAVIKQLWAKSCFYFIIQIFLTKSSCLITELKVLVAFTGGLLRLYVSHQRVVP